MARRKQAAQHPELGLPQQDYEALIELLDIHPDKIKPWKSPTEFQEITAGAIQKGTLKLRGREFDLNRLKHLCSFLFRSESSGEDRHFFHWELEFPEVFFHDDGSRRENPGFDAVIGNPPYGATLKTHEKEYIRVSFETSTYNFDSFAHFFEHMVRWLSAKYSSMIIPNTWLTTDDGQRLRELLLTRGHIVSILDTGNVFVAAIVDTIVLVFRKTAANDPAELKTLVLRVKGQTPQERLQAIQAQKWFKCFTIPQAQFGLNPDKAFDIFVAPEERQVIAKIRSSSVPLNDLCEVARGARAYGLGEGNPPQTKELISAKKFHAMSRVNDTYYPHLTASEVHRYQEEPFEEWLTYGPWLAVQGEWRFFSQPRILLQRVIRLRPSRFVAVWLTGDKLNNTDVLNIISRDKVCSVHFILALLNSRLLPWYEARTNANLERAAFPKINVQDAAALPVRRITFNTPVSDRKRHVAKGRDLYERCSKRSDAAELLDFAGKQIDAGRADVIHDLLVLLAERMMALNKDKQTAAKQFLTDLKDFHGIEPRSLTPKTKLDEFWKLQVGEVFAHFRANKLRFKEGDDEKLRTRFQKAQDKLVPLDSQIEFTDRQIDQIVYRLYGLTAEEVKLVEESVKK